MMRVEDGLPASIRVGYRTFTTEIMTPRQAEARNAYGECDNAQGIIRIWADLDPVKSADTMIHEVLHACYCIAALEDEDKEERIVRTLAHQLAQVWRDNPALIEWINARLS